MEKSYEITTYELATERAEEIHSQFIKEVKRLVQSGAVDRESHSRGLVFGVALENLADLFLRGERNTKSYKNLRRF